MKNKPYKILFCLISSTIFMNAPQALQYECVKNNQAPTDNNKYGIEIMYANTDQPDQIALDHISLDARIRTSAKSPMDFNITYTKNKKTGLYDLLYVENRNAYASDMNWELVFKDGIPPTLKIPTKPNSKTYNSYQCTLIYKNADSLIGASLGEKTIQSASANTKANTAKSNNLYRIFWQDNIQAYTAELDGDTIKILPAIYIPQS